MIEMNCIICSGRMAFYFRKQFCIYGLDVVEYWRCGECGFVASKTHFEMDHARWEMLNADFHHDNNRREDNPHNRNQRYLNQALMLHLMAQGEVLPVGDWLDWGAGKGDVSIRLRNWFSLNLANFDAYIQPAINPVAPGELRRRGYSLVLNAAVFEHVRGRATLDEIESYVSPEGQLAVHTLVRGEIPADPNWMYLLPVHCAFHTNRSMQMLMEQWNYTSSVYNENAKLWVMFKRPAAEIAEKVRMLNSALGFEYLHFKKGFMDYWP
jgi:hypothetical protein